MSIGVLVSLRANTDIDKEFKKIKELELDCCQVSCWDNALYTDKVAEELLAAAKKYKVEITALWAGWSGPREWNFTHGPTTLGLVPPAYRAMRAKELLEAGDFAARLGVDSIVTHAGFLPENPCDEEFIGTVGVLRHICRKLKEKGINFLFETGQETPVTMLRTIEAIGCDNVGINFDTANLILYGKANSLDALDVFGKYVRNTHCKDGLYPTSGSKLGVETKLGDGKANMPAIVEKLNALGYDGPYIIEREISGDQQIADIVAARDLLRDIFKNVKEK